MIKIKASLLVIVALILGLAAGYKIGPKIRQLRGAVVQSQPTTTSQSQPVEAPKGLTLPADAKKLSDCIPEMGEHWAKPSDMPFGPIYLVDKGQVVGSEYMMSEKDLKKDIITIASEKEGKAIVMPTLGGTYDHVEINWEPNGHEGFKVPHYDVHMYLVSSQEQQNLCK